MRAISHPIQRLQPLQPIDFQASAISSFSPLNSVSNHIWKTKNKRDLHERQPNLRAPIYYEEKRSWWDFRTTTYSSRELNFTQIASFVKGSPLDVFLYTIDWLMKISTGETKPYKKLQLLEYLQIRNQILDSSSSTYSRENAQNLLFYESYMRAVRSYNPELTYEENQEQCVQNYLNLLNTTFSVPENTLPFGDREVMQSHYTAILQSSGLSHTLLHSQCKNVFYTKFTAVYESENTNDPPIRITFPFSNKQSFICLVESGLIVIPPNGDLLFYHTTNEQDFHALWDRIATEGLGLPTNLPGPLKEMKEREGKRYYFSRWNPQLKPLPFTSIRSPAYYVQTLVHSYSATPFTEEIMGIPCQQEASNRRESLRALLFLSKMAILPKSIVEEAKEISCPEEASIHGESLKLFVFLSKMGIPLRSIKDPIFQNSLRAATNFQSIRSLQEAVKIALSTLANTTTSVELSYPSFSEQEILHTARRTRVKGFLQLAKAVQAAASSKQEASLQENQLEFLDQFLTVNNTFNDTTFANQTESVRAFS